MRFRHVLGVVAVALMTVAAVADDDPGAPAEALMKAAQSRAGAAIRQLEKLVIETTVEHPAFAERQAAWRALTEEKRELDRRIGAAAQASPAHTALIEARRELDEQLRVAREANDQARVDALNQTRYKNYQAIEALKTELEPEAVARSRAIASTLRGHLTQLVRLARTELREHPTFAGPVGAWELARQEEATQRAAMFAARGQVTAVAYLGSQPPPVFREGHTLPPLTRYGWSQPYELRKAFADDWGYALELGGYITMGVLARLDDPESDEAKTVALVNSDPARYKLSVTCARHFPEVAPEGTWTRDAEGKLLDAEAKSYDGTEWHPGMKTVISPLAPDALWEECARGRAEPLAAVRQRVPISIVLNGGEYGLGVLGFAGKVWRQDPRIVAAVGEEGDWFDFISRRKAHAETIIAEAVRAAVPDRDLYIYYTTSGGGHRNRWPGWSAWGFDYRHMQPISDLPSDEHYVNHFNSGWRGDMDILSLALNSAGVQIANGQPLAYSWFWCRRQDEDMRLFMGFLKCIYVMGTVGGNAGAYHQPDFQAGFKPEEPPYWMAQQIVLSRAHAFFSHLEDYLRHGDLVPGPYRHFWTNDNPAYELLPVELKDQAATRNGHEVLAMGRPVRVLARRHQTRPECLVVAWAADGEERTVTVDLPDFGEVKLLARAAGSVYVVRQGEGGPTVHLCDVDPELPSRTFAPPPQP